MANNYLRFWGVRGSYPAPFASHMKIGGNTPCVELRLGDDILIFDAGTGIIPFGNALLKETKGCQLSIILSHYHWDHITGLPFFVPAFLPGFKLDFYGPSQSPEILESRIAQQMKAPYFPVETATWLADIKYHTPQNESFEIGAAKISNFILHHPGLTYGYRVEVLGKVIIFAPDHEIFLLNHRIDSRRDEFDEEEQALLEDMKVEHRDRVIEFMGGADYLIHDAQYTPEDYERKRGWGHTCYIDTVKSAMEAGVKHLFPFSYDPNYDDAAIDGMHRHILGMIKEQGSNMTCHKTCEGMIIDLDS